MKYILTFIIFTVSLALISCAKSESCKVTASGTKVFPDYERHQIIEWEKALEVETHNLVFSGHNELEEIIKLVSENTQELEQSARTAYINQGLEYYKFGNELAREAFKESNQECSEQFYYLDKTLEQMYPVMEEKHRESLFQNFSKRKKQLIEKYFKITKESKTKDI